MSLSIRTLCHTSLLQITRVFRPSIISIKTFWRLQRCFVNATLSPYARFLECNEAWKIIPPKINFCRPATAAVKMYGQTETLGPAITTKRLCPSVKWHIMCFIRNRHGINFKSIKRYWIYTVLYIYPKCFPVLFIAGCLVSKETYCMKR